MPEVNEQLQAMFTDIERNAAAAIGESTELTVTEKIVDLFSTLSDPLLSANDVRALLGSTTTLQDVEIGLSKLCDEDQLESTATTQRPLDSEDVVLFRRADLPFERLKLVALQEKLPDGSSRFQFNCEGRLIRSIARVQRLQSLNATGQQRNEILNHIKKIAAGISSGIQVPNAILIVFLEENIEVIDTEEDSSQLPESFVVVRPISDQIESSNPQFDTAPSVQTVRLVEIDMPFRRAAFDGEKTALLVDGQQRTASLTLVPIDDVPAVDLSVNALIADQDTAREIFGVANSAKPIPTDFQLALASTMAEGSGYLKEDRLAAIATRTLAIIDETSPFYGITKFPGTDLDGPTVIVYNSLFKVVNEFKDSALGLDNSEEELTEAVKRSFAAVKHVWPEAWGKKPSEDARLMAGVGLRSMAQVLVWKLEQHIGEGGLDEAAWEDLGHFLGQLRTRVLWTQEAADDATQGAAKFWRDQIKSKQNTNQDISRLYKEILKIVPSVVGSN